MKLFEALDPTQYKTSEKLRIIRADLAARPAGELVMVAYFTLPFGAMCDLASIEACGTAACVAGHTLLRFGSDITLGYFDQQASAVLGISHQEMYNLFHEWSGPRRGETGAQYRERVREEKLVELEELAQRYEGLGL